MGWLIESLANVFLEILGDLMSITVNLITGLGFDIGYDTGSGWGAIVNPYEHHSSLLEKTFPEASNFVEVIWILAFTIVAFSFILKIYQAIGGPFTNAENPGAVTLRTVLAGIGVFYSYSIFALFEQVFNKIYQRFYDKYKDLTAGADSYVLDTAKKAKEATSDLPAFDPRRGEDKAYMAKQNEARATKAKDAYDQFGQDLIESAGTDGGGLGLTIIEIALFVLMLTCFIKLVIEIYERYIVIGVMYYTAPLAFSTLVSPTSTIFKNWVQMLVSEFIIMCSNLFFTGIFINAWQSKLDQEYLFKDPNDFITGMLLLIGWLIVGQQFDQHLKGLGLSTAQTGQGLGGAFVATLGASAYALRGIGRTAGNVATGAYDSAKKDIANGKTPFSTDKNAPDKKSLSGITDTNKKMGSLANNVAKTGGQIDPRTGKAIAGAGEAAKAAADKYNNALAKAGQETMSQLGASMGASNLKDALSSQGIGQNDIDYSSVSANDGIVTGSTYDGKNFAMMHDSAEGIKDEDGNAYSTVSCGNGWSRVATESDRTNDLRAEVKRLNDELPLGSEEKYVCGRLSKGEPLEIYKETREKDASGKFKPHHSQSTPDSISKKNYAKNESLSAASLFRKNK